MAETVGVAVAVGEDSEWAHATITPGRLERSDDHDCVKHKSTTAFLEVLSLFP